MGTKGENYNLSNESPFLPLTTANLTLFAQIISLLPREKIRKIIKEPGTDKQCKVYNTWSQFVSMYINPDVDVLSFESFFVSLHCWNGFGG